MMKHINTYGELLDEIERVKQAIKEVKQGFGYEEGDEFDLELYLIDLEKTKQYNEKKWRFEKKYGIHDCEKCGSINLDIMKTEDIQTLSYNYNCTCKDCGHKWVSTISKTDLKYDLTEWASHNSLW